MRTSPFFKPHHLSPVLLSELVFQLFFLLFAFSNQNYLSNIWIWLLLCLKFIKWLFIILRGKIRKYLTTVQKKRPIYLFSLLSDTLCHLHSTLQSCWASLRSWIDLALPHQRLSVTVITINQLHFFHCHGSRIWYWWSILVAKCSSQL